MVVVNKDNKPGPLYFVSLFSAMPQSTIHFSSSSSSNNGSDDIRLLEFQGTFDGIDAASELGSLILHPKPVMIVGNYRLIGKIVTLKKALLVLRKDPQSGLEAVAVIREKVVFDERPILHTIDGSNKRIKL